MTTVGYVLREKGHTVWSVAPELAVFDALKLMAEKEVGAMVVVDQQRMVGIFSERDYARKVALMGRSSLTTAVVEIMTEVVSTVNPSQGIDECMAIMTNRRVRHLPVIDGEELVGIISIGDVVKAIIAEQADTIRHLEGYIRGSR